MGSRKRSETKRETRKRITYKKKALDSKDKVRIYEVLRKILLKSKYKNAKASMHFIEDNMKYTLSIEKQFESNFSFKLVNAAVDEVVKIDLEEDLKCDESKVVILDISNVNEEKEASNEISILSELVNGVWEEN